MPTNSIFKKFFPFIRVELFEQMDIMLNLKQLIALRASIDNLIERINITKKDKNNLGGIKPSKVASHSNQISFSKIYL